MAKIRISSQNPADVPIPLPGEITIFSDSTDNNIPKYKTSDGIVHPFGDGGAIGEHRDSVLSVDADPSTLTPSIGDRHLIADGAVGDWTGKDGQIAVRGSFDWAYSTPQNGWTVKVDDDNTILYHHEGDYVSGVWSWIIQSFTEEWQDSVLSIETDPSTLTPSDNDRFLIGTSAVGIWSGKDDQIATWNGAAYEYFEPNDGTNVKVDDDDASGLQFIPYHYEGDYPSGQWNRIPTLNADIFDANTILKADVDNIPVALAIPEDTIVGRKTSGNIDALSASEVKTLLGTTWAEILASGNQALGNDVIVDPTGTVDDNLFLNSPDVIIRSKYDSDPAVGPITESDFDTVIRSVVTAAGASPTGFGDILVNGSSRIRMHENDAIATMGISDNVADTFYTKNLELQGNVLGKYTAQPDIQGGYDDLTIITRKILNDAISAGIVVITDDKIPRGDGTTIEDGTWENVGNDIRPVTDGSNIGDATHKVGTIFMSSIIDYGTDLIFKRSGTEHMRIDSAGKVGVNVTPTASFHAKGVGTTSGTTNFRTENLDNTKFINFNDQGDLVIRSGAMRFENVTGSFLLQVESSAGGNAGIALKRDGVEHGRFTLGPFGVEIYTFLGGTDTIKFFDSNALLRVQMGFVPGSADFQIIPENATSVSTLQDIKLLLRGKFWNGSVSVDTDATIIHDVTSTSPESSLKFTVGAASDVFIIRSDSRIGINTSTPSEALHVVGNAIVSQHMAIGASAAIQSGEIIRVFETVSDTNATGISVFLRSSTSTSTNQFASIQGDFGTTGLNGTTGHTLRNFWSLFTHSNTNTATFDTVALFETASQIGTTTGTVTNLYHFRTGVISQSVDPTNTYGLWLGDLGGTNQFPIWQDGSVGTNNFGADSEFGSRVAVGSSASIDQKVLIRASESQTTTGSFYFAYGMYLTPTLSVGHSTALLRGIETTATMTGATAGGTLHGLFASAVYNNSSGGNAVVNAINAKVSTGASVFDNDVTEIVVINVDVPTFSGKPTNNYGVQILNQGLSGITTSAAINIVNQTGSTNNYSIIVAGGRMVVGATTSDAAAILELKSTTQGVLFPRMTTTQRDAIGTPPDGLVIYNTTTNALEARENSVWVNL